MDVEFPAYSWALMWQRSGGKGKTFNVNPQQSFTSSEGYTIRFQCLNGILGAWVTENSHEGCVSADIHAPVICAKNKSLSAQLHCLKNQPPSRQKKFLHYLKSSSNGINDGHYVYIGQMCLKGGMMREGRDSKKNKAETARQNVKFNSTVEAPSSSESNCSTAADIRSTEDLIKTINAVQNNEEERNLIKWVESYIDWFIDQPLCSILNEEEVIIEYSLLVHIQPRSEELKTVLRRFIKSLIDKSRGDHFKSEQLGQVLCYVIFHMTEVILDDDTTVSYLIDLIHELLVAFESDTSMPTANMYLSSRALLYALHEALVLVEKPNCPASFLSSVNGLSTRYVKLLKGINKRTQDHRMKFHSLILTQRMQQKSKQISTYKATLSELGLLGAVYLTEKSKYFALLAVEKEELRSTLLHLQKEIDSAASKEELWFNLLQAVRYASIFSIKDDDITKFQEVLVMVRAADVDEIRKRKALQHGVLEELQAVGLLAESQATQLSIIETLQELSVEWADNPDSAHMLLDCYYFLAKQRLKKEEALKEVLKISMTELSEDQRSSKRSSLRTAIEKIRNGEGLDRVISMLTTENQSANNCLFRHIKGIIPDMPLLESNAASDDNIPAPSWSTPIECASEERSVATESDVSKHSTDSKEEVLQPPLLAALQSSPNVCEVLKKYYEQFGTVYSPFEGSSFPIENAQCHLLAFKKVFVSKKTTDDPVGGPHKQAEYLKVPLMIDELFDDRCTEDGNGPQKISRIVLIGNAQTGKTTLARKLVYLWARGKWGTSFEFVFLLHIETLYTIFKESSDVSETDAVFTAIRNRYFKDMEHQDREKVYQQVRDSLLESSTLVLLDGLDKNFDEIDDLVRSVFKRRFKVLLFLQPGSGTQKYPHTDLIIEHAGMSDEQINDFIYHHISHSEKAASLISLLQKLPLLHQACNLPTNLEAICLSWLQDEAAFRETIGNGGLLEVYGMITKSIWDCSNNVDEGKSAAVSSRSECFALLGEITLLCLKKGDMFLSIDSVNEVIGKYRNGKSILEKCKSLIVETDRQYRFKNFTFHEFFAGKRLAHDFISNNQQTREMAVSILLTHKYHQRHKMMISFLAEEVLTVEGVSGMNQLLETVDGEPREVAGLSHLFLQVQIANAWLYVRAENYEVEWEKLDKGLKLTSSLINWMSETNYNVIHSLNVDECLTFHAAALQRMPIILIQLTHEILQTAIEKATDDEDWVHHRKVITMLRITKNSASLDKRNIIHPLLSANTDDNWKVRRVVVLMMDKVIASLPEYAPSLLDSLQNAAKEIRPNIQQPAISTLRRLAKTDPSYSGAIILPFLSTSNDSSAEFQRQTISIISQLAEACSHNASEIIQSITVYAKNSSSPKIRIAATTVLGQLVETFSKSSAQLKQSLIQVMNDNDPEVRGVVISALRKLAQSFPALVSDIIQPLILASKGTNQIVRELVVSTLKDLVETHPDCIPQVKQSLLVATSDNDQEVREVAALALRQLAHVCSAVVSDVIQPLILVSKSSNQSIRDIVILTLGELVEMYPDCAMQVKQSLIFATHGDSPDIREVSVLALRQLAEVNPALVSDTVLPLILASKNSNQSIRNSVISTIVQLVAKNPDCSTNVKQSLVFAMHDTDPDVREVAVSALMRLAQDLPSLVPDIMQLLILASKDSNHRVRKIAIPTLSQSVDTYSEFMQQVKESLILATKDSDEGTRKCAVSALRELAAAHPAVTSDIVLPLILAMEDTSMDVRDVAKLYLESVPTNDLVKAYFNHRTEHIFRFIAGQLLLSPLTIQSGQIGYKRMNLFLPGQENISLGEWPEQQVEHFVKKVKNAYHSTKQPESLKRMKSDKKFWQRKPSKG